MSYPTLAPVISAARGWPRTAAIFAEAAREYQVARGAKPGAKSVETTARTNGELVPVRGALLLDAIHAAGIDPAQARLLEAGCGFGALAAYFATQGGGSVVGSDARPDFIELARGSAKLAGLGGSLDFIEADIRGLEPFPDHSFDAVVAAGVAVYLEPARDLPAALRSFLRVLRPGGCLVVYQANGWWLPTVLRRAPGLREKNAHLRLTGPAATRRALVTLGFENAQVSGLLRDVRLPSLLSAFGSYYVVTAQAPAVASSPDGAGY